MRYLPGLLLLITIGSCSAEQMTVDDLYKLCTSVKPNEKTACTFYILGVFEGAGLVASTVKENGANTFREQENKPFCIPEDLTSTAMELVIKMKMGEDVTVFPKDREMPAVSLILAIINHEFPCKKTK
jgi:hypothetical protein